MDNDDKETSKNDNKLSLTVWAHVCNIGETHTQQTRGKKRISRKKKYKKRRWW
jgi:hypothetical protein